MARYVLRIAGAVHFEPLTGGLTYDLEFTPEPVDGEPMNDGEPYQDGSGGMHTVDQLRCAFFDMLSSALRDWLGDIGDREEDDNE